MAAVYSPPAGVKQLISTYVLAGSQQIIVSHKLFDFFVTFSLLAGCSPTGMFMAVSYYSKLVSN